MYFKTTIRLAALFFATTVYSQPINQVTESNSALVPRFDFGPVFWPGPGARNHARAQLNRRRIFFAAPDRKSDFAGMEDISQAGPRKPTKSEKAGKRPPRLKARQISENEGFGSTLGPGKKSNNENLAERFPQQQETSDTNAELEYEHSKKLSPQEGDNSDVDGNPKEHNRGH